MSKSHVFISYRRNDSEIASRLRLALMAVGHEVWWDSDLQTGGRWAEDIDQALRNAYAVVVLWSESAKSSEWVKHEASVARVSRTLVQARIDDCSLPPAFASEQAADLRSWRGNERDPSFQQLLQAINQRRTSPRIRFFGRCVIYVAAAASLAVGVGTYVRHNHAINSAASKAAEITSGPGALDGWYEAPNGERLSLASTDSGVTYKVRSDQNSTRDVGHDFVGLGAMQNRDRMLAVVKYRDDDSKYKGLTSYCEAEFSRLQGQSCFQLRCMEPSGDMKFKSQYNGSSYCRAVSR